MIIKLERFTNNISVKNINLVYKYLLKEIPYFKNSYNEYKETIVYLDLESIKWIDSSFIQLILYLDNQLTKFGKKIKLKNINEIIKIEFKNAFIDIDQFL